MGCNCSHPRLRRAVPAGLRLPFSDDGLLRRVKTPTPASADDAFVGMETGGPTIDGSYTYAHHAARSPSCGMVIIAAGRSRRIGKHASTRPPDDRLQPFVRTTQRGSAGSSDTVFIFVCSCFFFARWRLCFGRRPRLAPACYFRRPTFLHVTFCFASISHTPLSHQPLPHTGYHQSASSASITPLDSSLLAASALPPADRCGASAASSSPPSS